MGILVHSHQHDDVTTHTVPAACPWSVHLADEAAKALMFAPNSLTTAQQEVASARVIDARRYVPNVPATYDLWALLNLQN